ncbi:asparagine synthase (glutamine-hydrolyzing) [Hyphobacterium sp. CCMP332]|nr:asparagine synthase (glutamine-hydrolyzing) [Hyphobacterium sp. CCMP332]
MCGIVGIYHSDSKRIEESLINNMTQSLSHRGPDGDGIFIDGPLALGHRRLSIIDLNPRSNQPMISRNKNWVLIFNGCIYNFKKLKQELIKKGVVFSTESDTEVILEGIAFEGLGFVKKLDGMFAFAIWEKKSRTLHLCRDRYGVKPLYYWKGNGIFAFSSEIKAFMKHPAFKVDVNYEALNEYFTFQNLFQYHTLFKDVFLIPPANLISIKNPSQSVTHNPWWDYNFTEPDYKMSFEDSVETTKELIEKAVNKQLVSDVPLGSYLSGGMDSGAITAIASQNIKRIPTFTAGFDMNEVTGVETNYDERRDAELTANYYKTEHYEQVINAGDLDWSLPKVIWHLEDLKVGMSYPNFYISRLASKFVKVCLQGTGGDELFGGYPWRYYRVFHSLDQKQFFGEYFDFWQRLVKDEDKKALFNQNVFSRININRPREVFERVFTFNENLKYENPEHHIENSLYFEIKTFLPGLLIMGDKLSMAHGLEERFPFLDNDLVDFAQKIPVKYKLANLEDMKKFDENQVNKINRYYREYDDGKNVLRKAMRDILPDKIVNRKKQGFSAPDESWYRGENADYVKNLLLNSKTISSEFINPDFIRKTLHEHIDQKINHRLLIWSLMSFEWWCRLFLDNQKIPD